MLNNEQAGKNIYVCVCMSTQLGQLFPKPMKFVTLGSYTVSDILEDDLSACI